jgi:RNA polymerase sigma-70 factor, ECF subfamily
VSDNYDNTIDLSLVQGIRSGRRECYGRLVDRHLASVFAVARRITGNDPDAEDVAQDTFMRAFDRISQYEDRFSFRNWLLKIATHLAVSQVRSRQRERRQIIPFSEHLAAQTAADPSSGDEDARRCRDFLDRLEDDQRTALVLFHFQELPYAQVAETMNISVNTVRTLIHRGRARLRELLTRKNPTLEPRVQEQKIWNVGT